MLSFSVVTFIAFLPIFNSNEIIISYGLHPFNICQKNPDFWNFIKYSFIFLSCCTNFIFGNILFNFINKIILSSHVSKKEFKSCNNIKSNTLNLIIGKSLNNKIISIPEKGLYQNFLITGTIGSGKTSSAMYPFTKQLIKYSLTVQKLGLLILDVKGNYYKYVKSLCYKYKCPSNLIVISLKSNIRYNPLDKPNLKPHVLANRLKTILLLFSENNSESFWLDKAEEVLCESIKLCRLYNNNYVTFKELHKLIFYPNYYSEKITFLKKLFISGKLSKRQIYDLNSCLNFFQKEYENLDNRTLSILKSEIGRITNTFISDFDVLRTFSPQKKDINFHRFF